MDIKFVNILSSFMVLFAVIDITGSIPIIIDLKKKAGEIQSAKASIISFFIMLIFLLAGEKILHLFGVDISSFAIAGAFILFFLALEMVLGIDLFKDSGHGNTTSIVPLAFPLIAGAGSMTTLLSLRAEYQLVEIIIALVLNVILVYIVLKMTHVFERILGQSGILILRKIFGIILLAIAIKLFMSNVALSISKFFPGLIN
ncbi:MAG: NAAT family transporter [Bacteroidales bacterium]|nr:NAAT family transporter [Bacteroidales bacterium]MBN2756575.1 NAAT family transporter [Bacteroidales bacterium]